MTQQDPYIPPEQSLPEITIKAIVLGVVLAMLLAGANAYLGLKAGITVSASIPAAVISMALLRAFRRSNILENNIVQTAASAGESLAAGVIFTLPALVLLGRWTGFNYVETTIIAGLGGMLGVLFTIPLRRALIVETPLAFPEGVATAEVLKVGERAGAGVRFIIQGAIIGALFKVGETGLRIWAGTVEGGRQVGHTIAYAGTNVAPALVAVGYIVGFNIAVLIFLGGAINWYAAIPIYSLRSEWPVHEPVDRLGDVEAEAWDAFPVTVPEIEGWTDAEIEAMQATIADARETGLEDTGIVAELATQYALGWPLSPSPGEVPALMARVESIESIGRPVNADDWANRIWAERTRYLGVGAMLVGGLWALLRLFPSLVRGIASGVRAYRALGEGGPPVLRTERDTPMTWVGAAMVLSIIPLFAVFHHVTGSVSTAAFMAVAMLVAGFLFSAVASYMAGMVGSSNNPISGVTIATILTSALLLSVLGTDSMVGPAAAILIGGVVCCAAALGGDNMQDLKTGRIVGATPYKQQIMQAVGVLSAALVIAPVLQALNRAYGIGTASGRPDPLEAPQATLMQSVAEGVFADNLPWDLVYYGMGIAGLIIVIDLILERVRSSFRAPVLAVAVGIYLPLELSVPILIGGLVSLAARRFHVRRIAKQADGELRASLQEAADTSGRHGLLMAAGLITGEALLGILLAIPLAAWGGHNLVAAWFSDATGLAEPMTVPGLLLLGVVIVVLYRTARGRD